MRIAVLAHNLRMAGGLSVGQNTIDALRRVANEHDYLLIMPAGVGYEALERPTRAECHYYQRRRGSIGQWLYERFTVPKLVHDFRPEIVWGLGNFGLKNPQAKQAFLFHKSQFIYGRNHTRIEAAGPRFRNYLARRRLLKSLPATQLVFCQTKTAAERFRRYLGYSGHIALMPNAVSRFTSAGDPSRVPPVFERLRDKFVLFCLTKYYAHKNLERLVQVFRQYGEHLADVAVLFTVRADQHRRAGAFIESLADPLVCEQLINVGPVRQRELAAYFTHSQALILPTLLESFSSTYLEAMQFRCPILTSDLDFARDICGSAAHYFAPFDPASIRDAIVELKRSPELQEQLVAAGVERHQSLVRDWDSIVADAVHELTMLVHGS